MIRSEHRLESPLTRWPGLPLTEWADTRDTLQLWTQVIGKVRLANEPVVNHWWNVTLYVTARGLTTSLMSHRSGPGFQIDLDFQTQQLEIVTTGGTQRSRPLRSEPVGDFYSAVMGMLDELGVSTPIWPMPVEIEGALPFTEDRVHTT